MEDYSLFWYLAHISTFISIVPIVVGLFIFKRLTPIQRVLFTLVLLVFTTEVTAYVFWQKELNNNPIYHVYAIIEFFLILQIFKIELTNLLFHKTFNIVFVLFLMFGVVNAVLWQNVFIFNSNVTTVLSLLVIVLVLIYYYSLLQKAKLEPLDKMPIFWISSGMMLYFSTNLILFFISKNEIFINKNGYTIWSIHSVVNILSICFYTYALWIKPKTE